MALTILEEPQDIHPAYNNMMLYASSTNATKEAFSYIVDIFVYINNVRTRVIRKKVLPRPSDNLLELDISRIIQNYVSYKIPFKFNAVEANGAFIRWDADIYESYLVGADITDVNFTQDAPFDVIFTVTSSTGINTGDVVQIIPSEINPPMPWLLSTQIVTAKTPTTITVGNLFNQNIQTQIQDYLSINTTFEGIMYKTTSFVTFFEDTIVTTTEGYNEKPKLAFNGSVKRKDFNLRLLANGNYELPPNYFRGRDYLTDNINAMALSNMPVDGMRITTWQNFFVNMYKEDDPFYRIISYNFDGSVRQIRRYDTAPQDTVVQVPMSPATVANGTVFVSGVNETFINDNVWKFGFAFGETGTSSKTYKLELRRDCNFTQEYEVLFLDRIGSMASFYFGGKSTKRKSVSREKSTNLIGNLRTVGESSTYGNNEFESNSKVTRTTELSSITLSTNWLNDVENIYIQDLLSSPVTFIREKNEEFYTPVTIKTSEFIELKAENDDNFKYIVEFDINNNEIINW